jgi:putative FmdB family regulatory protein
MPLYDYDCPHCGTFDAIRSIARREDPAACPTCEQAAQRVLLTAPRLADMDPFTRMAEATNERSRHEPQHSSRFRHPRGCGCCSGKQDGALTQARSKMDNGQPKAPKSFANKRPWMISH